MFLHLIIYNNDGVCRSYNRIILRLIIYPQRENHKKSSGKKSTNKDSPKPKEASADSGYDTPVLDEEKLNIEQGEGLELLKATNVEYFTEFKYWKPIMIGIGNTFPKEKAKEVAHFYSKKTTSGNYDADAV